MQRLPSVLTCPATGLLLDHEAAVINAIGEFFSGYSCGDRIPTQDSDRVVTGVNDVTLDEDFVAECLVSESGK